MLLTWNKTKEGHVTTVVPKDDFLIADILMGKSVHHMTLKVLDDNLLLIDLEPKNIDQIEALLLKHYAKR